MNPQICSLDIFQEVLLPIETQRNQNLRRRTWCEEHWDPERVWQVPVQGWKAMDEDLKFAQWFSNIGFVWNRVNW